MRNNKRVLIIGAGLQGLSLGKLFQEKGYYVEIHEKSNKIGGYCQDYWDKDCKTWVGNFGAHIAHFSDKQKDGLKFIKKYCKLRKYDHRVLCLGNNSNFTMWPINKTYKLINKILNTDVDMFKEFVESYSKKFWGKDYKEVIQNIRNRFEFKDNYNSSFFGNEKAFMPLNGYSELFKNLSKGIKIIYNKEDTIDTIYTIIEDWDYIFVTSEISEFFNYKFGKLDYKGIEYLFCNVDNDGGDLLATPVMNLNSHPKYFRMVDYNALYNQKNGIRKVCFESPSKSNLSHPVLTKKNLDILKKYRDYAKNYESNDIYFIGRLAEFRYKNMSDTICDSIKLFNSLK